MGARSGSIWNPYGNPYGNHISMSYATNFDLEPYGSHMEVIWKFQTKKNVTRLDLEAYGTHMEIHMEIINPCLKLLTSIWNHMEVIWKSYGNPYGNHISMSYVTNFDLEPYGSHMEVIWKSQTKKKLLGSFWKHMEPIWKSIWVPYASRTSLVTFFLFGTTIWFQIEVSNIRHGNMISIWISIWKSYFHVLCY